MNDLKQGHWTAKNCDIDYIVTMNNEKYCLYCLQTKNIIILNQIHNMKNFIENHVFICDLESVFQKYFEVKNEKK